MHRRVFLTHLGQLGALALLPGRAVRVQPPIARSLSAPRLDAHNHLMSEALTDVMRGWQQDPAIRAGMNARSGKTVVEELDRNGVERALVLSAAYNFALDMPGLARQSPNELREVQQENEFVAEEASKSAGRLVGFASVNPKRDYATDEVVRCIDRLGMRGLKVHFYSSDVRLRDPEHVRRVRAVLASAADRNVPVVAHVFNGAVTPFGAPDIDALVSEIIQPLPTLRMSIAHAAGLGGLGAEMREAFATLSRAIGRGPLASRVWIDCALVLLRGPATRPPTTDEDRKWGLDRLVWDTDGTELARAGELFRTWGLERIFWGSDADAGYLDRTRELWPLREDEWEIVARNDGTAFLGAGPAARR